MTERTHCKHGHELTDDNVVIKINRGRPFRKCRTCKRAETRKYNASHQSKELARRAARLAVQKRINNGSIERLPCEECGAPLTHAHHPNGYEGEARFQIVFLCPTHHAARHRRVA